MVEERGAGEWHGVEDFAENPDHWIAVRKYGVHMGVELCSKVHGTWKRWPIVLDRDLVNPGDLRLQLVEGRTRVGILRGRRLLVSVVADRHWPGSAADEHERPDTSPQRGDQRPS
ncbi:hypothetical protein M8J71_15545 [Pseudarthrobacter sp. R1]|uniref:hypothetical protein n=1 Tax=Pseudarthrobacter sp. R1 TaxID=2944934 RepID=UPI00210CEE86|nr:hypothetical protein [Pseudarthrobacter sp. R1]MCQ6271889.1 hypothetical protein [Pseudarthrobacter sp. R1]